MRMKIDLESNIAALDGVTDILSHQIVEVLDRWEASKAPEDVMDALDMLSELHVLVGSSGGSGVYDLLRAIVVSNVLTATLDFRRGRALITMLDD